MLGDGREILSRGRPPGLPTPAAVEYHFAAVHGLRGASGEAIRWLERATAEDLLLYQISRRDPFFDDLRDTGAWRT